MMNDLELWPRIRLVSIEGGTRSPLRRTLARTAWQRSPLASIRYESDRDRLLVRLIDAPTVAEAIAGDSDGVGLPASPGVEPTSSRQGGHFTGFDGIEPDAWPTTIAVLDFSRCRDADNPRLRLQQELCGDHIWTAARSAARRPQHGLLEVPLGHDEAEFLIRRWHAILTIPSGTGMAAAPIPGAPVAGTRSAVDHATHAQYGAADWATALRGPVGDRDGRPGRQPR
jgi:hypothetical protein